MEIDVTLQIKTTINPLNLMNAMEWREALDKDEFDEVSVYEIMNFLHDMPEPELADIFEDLVANHLFRLMDDNDYHGEILLRATRSFNDVKY